jgi:hypothetical protein
VNADFGFLHSAIRNPKSAFENNPALLNLNSVPEELLLRPIWLPWPPAFFFFPGVAAAVLFP